MKPQEMDFDIAPGAPAEKALGYYLSSGHNFEDPSGNLVSYPEFRLS